MTLYLQSLHNNITKIFFVFLILINHTQADSHKVLSLHVLHNIPVPLYSPLHGKKLVFQLLNEQIYTTFLHGFPAQNVWQLKIKFCQLLMKYQN